MKSITVKTRGRRESILQAAAPLCARQGIAETSLRQIARRAGISNGTLHYHFPSKEELIETLVLGVVEPLGRESMRIASDGRHPREQLEAIIRFAYEAFDENWDRYYVAIVLGDQVRAKLPADFPTATTAIVEIVRHGQRMGVVRSGEPVMLAILCHGMITRIPRGRVFKEIETPLEKYVNQVAEACWRVLSAG